MKLISSAGRSFSRCLELLLVAGLPNLARLYKPCYADAGTKDAAETPSLLTPLERMGMREALTKHLDAEAIEVISGDLDLAPAFLSEEKSLTWQWSKTIGAVERHGKESMGLLLLIALRWCPELRLERGLTPILTRFPTSGETA